MNFAFFQSKYLNNLTKFGCKLRICKQQVTKIEDSETKLPRLDYRLDVVNA